MRVNISQGIEQLCYRYPSPLVDTVTDVARKRVDVKYVSGPVGVQSRNFSNDKIYSTGWKPRFSLRDGIAGTYPWIAQQVERARRAQRSP